MSSCVYIYACNMIIIDDYLCDRVWGMCVRVAYMCVHTRDRRALVEREEDIQHNDHAVAVMKNGTVVGHMPHSISRLSCFFFLKRGGDLTCCPDVS